MPSTAQPQAATGRHPGDPAPCSPKVALDETEVEKPEGVPGLRSPGRQVLACGAGSRWHGFVRRLRPAGNAVGLLVPLLHTSTAEESEFLHHNIVVTPRNFLEAN